jgi:hypothetical protein
MTVATAPSNLPRRLPRRPTSSRATNLEELLTTDFKDLNVRGSLCDGQTPNVEP